MNKNKLTALCLAALLCCSVFAGCKGKPKNTESDKATALPEGAVTAEVTPEEMQELIEQGVIPDPNADPEDTKPQNVDPAPYTKGVVENNVYRNDACDLTLRIPTGWITQDDYNLCTLMGITYNFEDPEANLAEISKLADIYDLYITDINQVSSIVVLMQDLNQHGMGDVDPSAYLESMKGQFTSETATFEIGDISKVSYSGNEYSMMKTVTTPNEGEEVTQYFFVREANERMITVMMTSPTSDPINPDTIFA